MNVSRPFCIGILLAALCFPTTAWAEPAHAGAEPRQALAQPEGQTAAPSRFADWRNTDETSEIQATGPRMLQGLGLCLAIFSIGIYCTKRFRGRGFASSERRLRMLERMSVGQKTHLLLVTLDGKEFVISVGNERVQLIHAPDALTAEAMKEGFASFSAEELRVANLA